jgi:hypothetical protein
MLCDLAISPLEALHLGVHTKQQATQTQQYKGKVSTHTLNTQSPSGSSLSAHQALSQPYPHNSVNLTQLSAILSTISSAAQGMQCLSEQHKGAEQEHHTAVEKVQGLMKQTALEHASLFNEALEAACRSVTADTCLFEAILHLCIFDNCNMELTKQMFLALLYAVYCIAWLPYCCLGRRKDPGITDQCMQDA